MPLEEQVLTTDSPPFTIRHFVSTVRCNDFSKCWPFSRRILKRCILLGMKVDLPPLETPCKGPTSGSPSENVKICLQDAHEKLVLYAVSQERKPDVSDFDCKATSAGVYGGSLPTIRKLPLCNAEAPVLVKQADAEDGGQECCRSHQGPLVRTQSLHIDSDAAVKTESTSTSNFQVPITVEPWVVAPAKVNGAIVSTELDALLARNPELTSKNSKLVGVTPEVEHEQKWTVDMNVLTEPTLHSHSNANFSIQKRFQLSNLPTPDDQCCNDEQGCNESSEVPIESPHLAPILRPMGCHQKAVKGKNTENSNSSMPQVCPVCLKFSSTSNTALNAHIDHCLVHDEADHRRQNRRTKLKKMRSMADIYASAPVCILEDLE